MKVGDGVYVGVGVGDGVWLGVKVEEGVSVGLGVMLGASVSVGVWLGPGDGVEVADGDGEGVGEMGVTVAVAGTAAAVNEGDGFFARSTGVEEEQPTRISIANIKLTASPSEVKFSIFCSFFTI